MKKIIIIMLLILPAVTLSDDEVFFTLFVQPDVMLILDCSGSMTYDMSGTYTWGDGSDYYPGMDTDGNGYADDSRMYIAKNAISRIVYRRENLRWGFETYPGQRNTWDEADWYRESPWGSDDYVRIPWDYTGSGYDNGQILVGIAESDAAHLNSILYLIDHKKQIQELRAQGGTPIGGALYEARQFYVGEIHADNAKACRRYFNILVSDGKETGYPSYNSHSPYEEARNLRHTSVDGVEYDVQTYVVGIAIAGGEEAQCLDSIAKMGGTIHYYSATSAAALDSVLDVISSDIIQKAFAFSAPEVPAVRIKQMDKMYIGSFVPSYQAFWDGYLKCYRLNPDGTLPVDSLGVPLEEPYWDAGERLRIKSSNSRNIYTEVNGSLVQFIPAFVHDTMLGVPDTAVTNLINWVRGDNNMDWKLGDLYHSEPLVVVAPNPYYFEDGYNEFKQIHANRNRVIIVGTNGGMLHAFEAGTYVPAQDTFTHGTGDELWAYIPHNLLPKLKDMRTSHRYMVDGSPGASGVWIPSSEADTTKDADEWKTILVCGERGGGNHYFSLDITNTHYPSYMWDFTDIDLGETWSKPMICKVKIPGDRWVAVFGGGYHSNNEKGKAVYMLNTGNGNNIFKYDDTYSSDIKYSFPSSARSLDMSPMDGYTDRIYIGDLGGQMWRFDVSDSSTSSWTGTVIFTAPTATPGNPIFYPPSLSYDLEDNLWVFFGTGDRENPRDVSGQNRFYGIKDKGITLREANIKDITSGGSPPYTNGWFIKLVTGEKVLAGTVVVEGIVYFTTYQAINTGDPCAISGVAKLYRVNFTQGSYVVDVIGTSLPTTPQVSISSEGVLTIIISLAEGTIFTEISEAGPALKQLLYWKEIRP